MATGMLSSKQSLSGGAAATPAAPIRSGERMATSAASISDPNAETFYHMVPGARFIMPDGLEIVFLGGQFTTNDADVIHELSLVANKPTSSIYTKVAAVTSVARLQGQDKQLADDAADTAGTIKA